jgi:hypothetical protein
MPRKKTPKPKVKKATKAEIIRRTLEVYRMLIKSSPRAEILQYASENWHITERQTDEYIARAREMLREQSVYDRDIELALGVEFLKLVRGKSFGVTDYQRSIAAQRVINNMLGLNAPEKREVSGELIVKSYAQFNPDDWDKPETPET